MAVNIALLAGMLACCLADDNQKPRAYFPQTRLEFGEVVHGTPVEARIAIRNLGDAPLRIQNIRITKPMQATKIPAQVPPGAGISFAVRLDTAGLQGRFEGKIIITLNDPDEPETTVTVEGNIVPSIQLSPRAAFYVAANRGQSKQASIEIINHEAEPLTIHKIRHSGERFTTALETIETGKRYRLTLSLKADGPAGRSIEPILVHSSSKVHPLIRIIANTYLREKVYTFPDVVDLGSFPIGLLRDDQAAAQSLAQTLMVYEAGGTDFRLEMSSELPIRIESERGPNGDRYQATIRLVPERLQVGPIAGEIIILTNNREFPRLSVPVTGMILEK
jgi:Protein of unknown function (DUF1573)